MATGEQINIEISGPGPYGFRLYGGDGDPFVVAKLRPKSKAQKAGIVEGDVIIGINGQTCQNISHTVAMSLLEKTKDNLRLTVLRGGSKEAVSTAYQTIGSQLRPVSPNVLAEITNQTSSTSFPTYLTNTLQESVAESKPEVTYKKEEQTVSEEDTTRKITTESKTEQWDGTTVTKVTRHEVSETSREEPNDHHLTKTSVFLVSSGGAGPQQGAPAVWAPGSSSSASQDTHLYVDKPVTFTLDLSPVETKKENTRPAHFQTQSRPSPPDTHALPAGFKVSKTPAKAWVWQPSHKPVLPKRQPSPGFQLLDTPDQPPVSKSVESYLSEDKYRDESPSARRDASDLPYHLLRILTEESSDFETLRRKKKIFADSSFYDDPKHRYPTIEEQIKMARKVAMSLTAPVNVTARGQRMFIKRKEKANAWSIEYPGDGRHFHEEQENDLYYNPAPWKSARVEKSKTPPPEVLRPWEKTQVVHRNASEISSPAAPPYHTSSMFAKKIASFEDKAEQFASRDEHAFHKKVNPAGALAPQMCFNLAQDLRKQRSKGGNMFARRAARTNDSEGETSPNVDFMKKISEEYEPPRPTQDHVIQEEDEFGQPPASRLKELIEQTKPKLSPWDAAADYGNIDYAFQHLNNYKRTYPQQKIYGNQQLGGGSVSKGDSVDFSVKSRGGYHPVTFSAPQNLPENVGESEF